jgi:hypothetical protein
MPKNVEHVAKRYMKIGIINPSLPFVLRKRAPIAELSAPLTIIR